MNTTDEIMNLVDLFANKYRYCNLGDDALDDARFALRTAVNDLIEQAKWAHHTPALLSDADAAADLAGVARPGAEPDSKESVYIRELCRALDAALDFAGTVAGGASWWDDVWSDHDRAVEAARRATSTTPPQASQPEARPGAEPVAWINEEQTIGPSRGKKRLSFEPFYSSNPLHYKHTPLYTAPPQASQPERYIVPEFTSIAQRKLAELMADGYQITGYSIERTRDDIVQRGAVTCGGMVLWWHGSGQSPQARQPEARPGAEADVNETNAVLASRYFDLLRVVESYEKHGVTCQTFRHFVDAPCAECNSTLPTPQSSQPLTRKECLGLEVWPMMTIEQVVRVVEAAHGIGATQKGQP